MLSAVELALNLPSPTRTSRLESVDARHLLLGGTPEPDLAGLGAEDEREPSEARSAAAAMTQHARLRNLVSRAGFYPGSSAGVARSASAEANAA